MRVSDRRIYIGLHEMDSHTDTGTKAMYVHYDAFFEFLDSLDQATTAVANHLGTHTPIGGAATSEAWFEHLVRVALAHEW